MKGRTLGIIVLAIMLVGSPATTAPAEAAINTGCGFAKVTPEVSVVGDTVTMTVKVGPAPDRGVVSFFYVSSGGSAKPLGGVAIDPGTGSATLKSTAIPLGDWAITGQYYDSSGFYGFCQTPGTWIRVVKYVTSIAIQVDRSEAIVGDKITWVATVTPNPGPGVVVFRFRHGTSTSSRDASIDAATGKATMVRADLAPGVTEVWATFQKLPDYAPSTSPRVSVTVRQLNPGPLGLTVPATVLQLHPVTVRYTVPSPRPATGLAFYYRRGDGPAVRFTCTLDASAKTCTGAGPREVGTYAMWAVIPKTDEYVALKSDETPLVVERDGSVEMGSLSASATKFYPVKDGYRDRVTMKTRAFEPVTSRARVINANGRTVRKFDAVSSNGKQTWIWNGRKSSGRLVPDGTYRFVVQSVDRVGNKRSVRVKLLVSRQRLVWRTMRVTVPASRYSSSDRSVDGWVRTSASRYSGGAVVHGGSTTSSFARAFYKVRLPSGAKRFRKISVCAQGVARRGYRAPYVGLTNFSTARITWVQIPSAPASCWGISLKASNTNLKNYIRRGRIEGSIVASGYYGMSYDARRVGVTVRYATLSSPTSSAAGIEQDALDTALEPAPDLKMRSVPTENQKRTLPRQVRPARRVVVVDDASWDATVDVSDESGTQ